MSTREIPEALPKLAADELRQVQLKLSELSERQQHTDIKPLRAALLEFAGKTQGLPPDIAENHDHYLYGMPKRNT